MDKLKSASEYFAGLFRFSGKEVDTKEIRMEDDIEGLLHAFDAFIEFLYTGDYKNSESVLDAEVVVLAERLVADGVKEVAITKLENSLSTSKCTQPPVPSERINDPRILKIIRTVYEGTHRPFAELKSSDFAAIVRLPTKTMRVGHQSTSGLFSTPHLSTTEHICKKCGESYRRDPLSESEKCDRCRKEEIAEQNGYHKMGYRNCKARSCVAKYVAFFLESYRWNPEFRELLKDIGEFAEDIEWRL